MSRDDRASRRGRIAARPRGEPLEGRELLSAGPAQKGPAFDFRLPDYAVFSQQGGPAAITVARRDPRGTARAVVSTDIDGATAGTAVPGVQYLPVHETLAFRNGEATKTVSLPIVAGAPNPGVVSIGLFVKADAPDAPYSSAALPVVDRADVNRPRVTGAALLVRGHDVAAIRLAFDKPMAPEAVQDLSNYRVSVRRGSPLNNLFGFIGNAFLNPSAAGSQYVQSGPVSLRSATYDPARNLVTLALWSKVRTSNQFEISGVYLKPHGSPNPPTDLLGNPLRSFHVTIDRHSTIPGGVHAGNARTPVPRGKGHP